MGEKLRLFITIAIASIIILIFLIPLKLTAYSDSERKKQVQFYFYDEQINCSLNGYVFVGNELIGKTENGYFNLSYENYENNFKNQENISLFGSLKECFNLDLFFDKYWENFEIQDYYFFGESVFIFKTKINPTNPSKRELLGFIQPGKLESELSSINLNQEILKDLSEINNYANNKISYVKDWDFNKETNYWQTPFQTLNLRQGDCEDYSTTLLSLFLAYNSSLNCYNIILSSHVTTFCYISNYYVYYDQGKTELKKQINKINVEETKSLLKKLNQDYFGHYAIIENESKAYYAFNDNQYIEFSDEDDFIDWQYSLENKKQEFGIFEGLEKKVIEIQENENQEKYPAENIAELATQQPSTKENLATEKSAAKEFIAENFLMFILLLIIFIVLLIIILIKVNFHMPKAHDIFNILF